MEDNDILIKMLTINYCRIAFICFNIYMSGIGQMEFMQYIPSQSDIILHSVKPCDNFDCHFCGTQSKLAV